MTGLEKLYVSLKQCTRSENPCIGLFLSHSYTNTGLASANLKGSDKLVYDFLVEKGVPISLVSVVSSQKWERYDHEYDDEPDEKSITISDFPVRLLPGFADTRLDVHKNLPKDLPFLKGYYSPKLLVRDKDIPCHHTGNYYDPHSVDKVYIKAAMIIGPFAPAEKGEKHMG